MGKSILLLPALMFLFQFCQKHQNYHQTIIPSELEFLPLDEIKPEGWIRAQLLRDLETGFTGHLDSLTFYASADIFGSQKILGIKIDEGGKVQHIPKSWWPGETEPVWLDGFVRAAFLSGHQPSMEKMHNYINYILDNQEEDGYIGIYRPEIRYQHTTENAELWAQSRIFRVMLAYYEMTGDHKVLESVIKAVDLTLEQYGPDHSYFSTENALGGVSHGLMFMDVLEWLFRLTGDRRYAEFGEFLYQDYSNYDNRRLNDSRLEYLLDPEMEIVGHTPHAAEHLRVPVWLYHATGKEIYKTAWENGYKKLEKYMIPGGAVHSGEKEDVEGKPPTPDMPYEYCGITELFDTQRFLLEETGNTHYADMGEKLIMNAGQGARLPNGKAVTYFSRDNRYRATPEGSGGRFKYSPTHEDIAVCCNPNASKLMPYFVNGMWMKKHDDPGALITCFYGPACVKTELNGSTVKIRQKTEFPFSDTIYFSVEPEKNSSFEIWLRIPGWCNKLNIISEDATVSEKDGYRIIKKDWKRGDSFRVIFDTNIQTIEAVNGEIALQRGPLLYAVPLSHQMEVLKKYPLDGFADYQFTPENDEMWNLYLDKNRIGENFGFRFEYNTAYDKQYPWDRPPVQLKGVLMDREGSEVNVNLVPMGSTVLRRLTFPVL